MKKKELDNLIKLYPHSKIWKIAKYRNKNLDSIIMFLYIDYIYTEFDSIKDLKKIIIDQNNKKPKFTIMIQPK